jgi:hypothetical protein
MFYDFDAPLLFTGNNYPIIMISSSPTALITMHNVKRFLEESTYVFPPSHCFPCLLNASPSFEPSQDARARAASEGNTRPEDLIAIYRKRTHISHIGPALRLTFIAIPPHVVTNIYSIPLLQLHIW